MTEIPTETKRILLALQRAVIDALETKRRLGQCAVICRNGKVIAVGEDAAGSGVGGGKRIEE